MDDLEEVVGELENAHQRIWTAFDTLLRRARRIAFEYMNLYGGILQFSCLTFTEQVGMT